MEHVVNYDVKLDIVLVMSNNICMFQRKHNPVILQPASSRLRHRYEYTDCQSNIYPLCMFW